ncbi:PAS domain-containing protein [Sphingomonas japonica]|uniref:histidine kinase n=1 Tax=Sphingomonas japonica TaxID=511662 RepID=A0ABX0TZX0_9SPHN|nr:PAS domain-containing protein [Sphingomonas japonica]NIJ23864.1 PAS domain S-box-containing protein [Sphingomonas japonica]
MTLQVVSPTATVSDDAEVRRLQIVRGDDLAGLTDDPRLTAITDLAAALSGVPVGLITTIDAADQHFLARTGTDLTGTPRDISFCTHAIRGDGLMEVRDATTDPRFADNPLVTGELNIRFYAGVPLQVDGTAIGSLCVLGFEPHSLTPLQHQALTVLAQNVTTLIAARRGEREQRIAADRFRDERDDQAARFRVLADTMPQMVWSTTADGSHDYYNARWYEFTGMTPGSTDGDEWHGMFHPDDRDRAWTRWRECLASGDDYDIEYRLRDAHGQYRWVLGRALPIRDDNGAIIRWFGTCTDIHEHKLASDQREIVAHELSHRIKNIFSVIGGLIGFSTREHPQFKPVADTLRDRVMALGRAHDFVRPHSEASRPAAPQSSLHGMLAELLAAYQTPGLRRISITGDDPEIDDQSATPLALLFHELATNAAKYGALSTPDGVVGLHVAVEDAAVVFNWTEVGGPAVAVPASQGFGSRLIELSIDRQLGGSVTRDWRPEGLVVVARIPLMAMTRKRKG